MVRIPEDPGNHLVLSVGLSEPIFYRVVTPNLWPCIKWASEGGSKFGLWITNHFRYLKWRNPHLYKLYGYGLCKGVFPTAQNSLMRFRKPSILGNVKLLENSEWTLFHSIKKPIVKEPPIERWSCVFCWASNFCS